MYMYTLILPNLQLESLGIQEGEFAVSRDLLIDLWLKFREYNGELQLREVMGRGGGGGGGGIL